MSDARYSAGPRSETPTPTASTVDTPVDAGVGWARLGKPFAHALGGSRAGWALVVGSGLILGVNFPLLPAGPMDQTGVTSGPGTAVAWAALLAVLPLLTVVDLRIQMLPNRVIFPTALVCAVGILLDLVAGWSGLWEGIGTRPVLVALVAAATVWALGVLVLMLTPVGALGYGDVRLMTLGAFVLGTHSWWLPFGALMIVPGLVALPVLLIWMLVAAIFGTAAPKGIPFGPFLAMGIGLAAFCQPYFAAFMAP